MNIRTLFDAWQISGAYHSMKPPSTEADIRLAETKKGVTIPPPLREVYYHFNGGWALDLCFFPLEPPPEHYALTNANEKYIEYEWRIPQEIRLFADMGGEEVFGIWLSDLNNPIYNHPIIEVGWMPDEDGCMGVASTNLLSFLRGWSVYYLMLQDLDESKETAFLDRLEVPQSLRNEFFDDSQYDESDGGRDVHFTQLRKWADPLLPAPVGDSYSQQYTIADLRRVFGIGE